MNNLEETNNMDKDTWTSFILDPILSVISWLVKVFLFTICLILLPFP